MSYHFWPDPLTSHIVNLGYNLDDDAFYLYILTVSGKFIATHDNIDLAAIEPEFHKHGLELPQYMLDRLVLDGMLERFRLKQHLPSRWYESVPIWKEMPFELNEEEHRILLAKESNP